MAVVLLQLIAGNPPPLQETASDALERRLSELFLALLCTTVVHSDMHTCVSSSYSCIR